MDHSFFRPIVVLFCLAALFQFASGTWLYIQKAGLDPLDNLEYYRGSDFTRTIDPDRPERFIAAKTFVGLLKTQLGHSLGFILLIFIQAHLARSLTGEQLRRRFDIATLILFLLALGDFLMPFLATFGSVFFAYLRLPWMLLFSMIACLFSGAIVLVGARRA